MRRQQSDFVDSRSEPSGGRSLRVEYLEPRRMLATFTVTKFNDAGSGSLREAIDLGSGVALDSSLRSE